MIKKNEKRVERSLNTDRGGEDREREIARFIVPTKNLEKPSGWWKRDSGDRGGPERRGQGKFWGRSKEKRVGGHASLHPIFYNKKKTPERMKDRPYQNKGNMREKNEGGEERENSEPAARRERRKEMVR